MDVQVAAFRHLAQEGKEKSGLLADGIEMMPGSLFGVELFGSARLAGVHSVNATTSGTPIVAAIPRSNGHFT